MNDKYVKLADVKQKLRYILKSYGVGSFVREKIKSALNDLPYSVKSDLETTLEVSDVQPVNQWISVKDRLPEENILVLCYARSTTGEGNNYFLGALAHGEFWFLKVNDIGHVSYPVLHWEVTHWQPLPEPPKDGDVE